MGSAPNTTSQLFRRVLSEYPQGEIGEGLTSHETRTDIEELIPDALNEFIGDPELIIKGSVGKGLWASIPWVAILDPRETARTQNGLYVVYLFEPQEARVRLSLALGVTDLQNELGTSVARELLTDRATELRDELDIPGFDPGPVEFPHASNRNKLYGPGTVYYSEYTLDDIPGDAELRDDLIDLLEVYQDIIPTSFGDPKLPETNDVVSDESPTIYQVPISEGGKIEENFELSVQNGISRERLEDIVEVPGTEPSVRVWGNRSKDAASPGDFLLFALRDSRHSGEYQVLAQIQSADVLDEETARQFTERVGWSDASGAVFPHKMFLKPVWNVELDREHFWDVMGFKGWPNDTYSAIDFERAGSSFFETYNSVAAFVDHIKADQIYPPRTNNQHTKAGTYDSTEAAIADIRQRAQADKGGTSWFEERLGQTLLADWSDALRGFNPSDEVPASVAARYDQLRTIYLALEPELIADAEKWGVRTLGSLSPAATLFLGYSRVLYEDLEVSGAPLSHPRFNSILNDTYTTKTPSVSTERPDSGSPLGSHMADDEHAVYKVTAPPDYWLTSYAYASIGLEDSNRELWGAIEAGDVILFHSTGAPGWDALSDQRACLLGAGIVRGKASKSEDVEWWFDEAEGRPKSDTFPHLLAFDRLFATGDLNEIDLATPIREKASDVIDRELSILTQNGLPISEVNEISNGVSDTEFPTHQTILNLESFEQARAIVDALDPRLDDVAPVAVHRPFDGTIDAEVILEGLHFPGDQGEEIIGQIQGALRAGKHVILTGPPGTGKTAIAQRVADYLEHEYPYLYSGSQLTTATADWSTFDTVGGYMPNEAEADGVNLAFTPGLVLNRFKHRESNTQRNEPLVVDELNRADIDKAFGQLFTVLSGQPVQLPYTKDGREVELAPADGRSVPALHEYRIPESWSLFATLNTYDKTSLYEMSYAFMRRFAFIRVPAPPLKHLDETGLRDLIDTYVNTWQVDGTEIESPSETDPVFDVALVWQAANGAIDDRAIGPAVVKDMLEYLQQTAGTAWNRRLTNAVISYILPQLEGVPKRERVVRQIADVEAIDLQLLDQASRDMLNVSATEERDETS